ncbi:hypothetical protein AAFF_G00385360 [Aldrovandia affinis]|uniref:Uncharacterized protein n=1 Tax=Aldrovandia affinis TaxID=143900 RepID=A0AAD7SF34_9TELE|nr:hypothetical protein AAFF_G00385360 [Aldrovandia affinis]
MRRQVLALNLKGRALLHSTGHYIRDICVYGLGDLQWVVRKHSMFANKFEMKAFPEAVDCLEQWHRHKVLRQAEVPILSAWRLSAGSDRDAGNANGTALVPETPVARSGAGPRSPAGSLVASSETESARRAGGLREEKNGTLPGSAADITRASIADQAHSGRGKKCCN